jgi:bifunctional enzyme CysN/CysC
LLDYLETVDVADRAEATGLRFPVQLVSRPHGDFRGVAGTVAAGSVAPGDAVVVAGSGVQSRVKEILTFDGPVGARGAGDAVTLTFTDDIDVARGDLLANPNRAPNSPINSPRMSSG